MRQGFGRRSVNRFQSFHPAFLARVIATSAVVCAFSSGVTRAQTGETYTGTIEVSGTEIDPQVSYSAGGKVTLPVTDRDGSSITAEFLSGEAPDATILISQWDESYTEKFPDSDGKFNSWSCTLTAPTEVPMSVTGVLNVDLMAKTHALSLTLLSTWDLAFDCTHSRSGPYKNKKPVLLYLGTGFPGEHYETRLPFSDAARLSAKYTLMPNAQTQGKTGPIVQEWDLRLTR